MSPMIDEVANRLRSDQLQDLQGVLFYLAAILERLPRVDAAHRAVVSVNEIGLPTSQTLTSVTNITGYLAQLGATGRTADLIPFQASQAAAVLLYDRIVVS